MAQEVRNQWGDEDLRRRDMNKRGSAWVVSGPLSEDEPAGDWDGPDYAQLVESGLDGHGAHGECQGHSPGGPGRH